MKVIVDTVVWSIALRRKKPDLALNQELTSLIEDQRVLMLGPIRQEILSGYSDADKFTKLKEKLSYFPNELILDKDYEEAAKLHNACRVKGVQGSHIDFLICACAKRINASIYTRDDDFKHFGKCIDVELYEEGES